LDGSGVLVFIDESGDPGFKVQKGSTSAFTAALVAFESVEQARASQAAIESTAKRLRIFPEFKFSKCRPEVRDAFFKAVSPYDFCVRAIMVRKERIYSTHLRTDKESFYSFFVKSMLRYDGGLLSKAQIIIDGSGDRVFRREIGACPRQNPDRVDVAAAACCALNLVVLPFKSTRVTRQLRNSVELSHMRNAKARNRG
jgi:hypothetical protein